MEKYYPDNEWILVNETFFADLNIDQEWLAYFMSQYLTEIKQNIEIEQYIFSKISENYNPDGNSYSFQIVIQNNKEILEKLFLLLDKINEKISTIFNDKVLIVQTNMEIKSFWQKG
ncbi:MAG: DUF4286 family protein [Saprospiraceae bacterium]